MPLPFPSINVTVGIADTIRAIDEIRQRPKDQLAHKQDETLSALHQQLDIVFTVITKLEDLSIEILRGFMDEEILSNPEALKAHVAETEVFLTSKKLLPYLEKAIGAVDGAAFNARFQDDNYREMVTGLKNLSRNLHNFRNILGGGGYTAPGLGQLIQLCSLAKYQLEGDRLVNPDIAETARKAFEEYDWQLSSDIRRLIGYVILNS